MASLFCVGARAGFYSGDVRELMDDVAELRPTILVAVPRLLNRMRDKILGRIEAQPAWVGNTCGTACPPPKLVRYLFRKGFASKKRNLHAKHMLEDGFWDSTVFGSVQQRLGGRIRLIITGSAPISSDVLDFLRVCFSCEVVEGYGQTECGAAMSVSYPRDTTTGNIGVPAPQCQIKLVDVPEMEYLTSDKPYPRGEICCKGPNVFQGYYQEEDKTHEAIDADGWLHSGDVGRWNADGTLTIIDRKKNVQRTHLPAARHAPAHKRLRVPVAPLPPVHSAPTSILTSPAPPSRSSNLRRANTSPPKSWRHARSPRTSLRKPSSKETR